MAIYLCDITAFSFWFGEGQRGRSVTGYPALRSLADATAAASELPERDLARLGITERPVHVLVPDHHLLRRSQVVFAHVWSGPYPDRSFVCLAPEVFIESPALCLIRYGQRLRDGELLRWCNQLCGSFYLAGGQIHQRQRPLNTLAELEAYVRKAKGAHGVKRIRKLLPRVSEGAASPREAQLAAVLRMLPSKGGCGLPPFLLNHPVLLGADGHALRIADILWEMLKIILEYDSDQFHTGAEKIGLDAARRVELEAAGYRVITLTNHQLRNEDEFLEVAGLLRAHMGLGPLPIESPEFLQHHRALKQEVFGA